MKRDSAGFTDDLHGSAWQWVRGLYAVTPETTDTAGLQRKVQAAIAGGAGWFNIATKRRTRYCARSRLEL
jgi:hypothetical protein